MDDQDWELVTVKRGRYAAKAAAKTTGPSQVRVNYNSEASAARKLEATESGKLQQLSPESRQQIISLRASNSWTQIDLNQKCSFPSNTIRDIESGKVCPSIGQLNVLNRVLKCGLKFA